MELKSFDFSQKVALHPDRYYEIKQNKRPFPLTIEVDLTNHCNHRCSFCVWGEHISTDKSSLDTDVINKCLADMRKLGAKAITFTGGGESMIHKDFHKILLKTKPFLSTTFKLASSNKEHNSSGVRNFCQSWVPFGNHLIIYSAPIIALR